MAFLRPKQETGPDTRRRAERAAEGDRRRGSWKDFRRAYPGFVFVLGLGLAAMVGIDAWLLAKRVKYNHDVCPWLSQDVRKWLHRNALQICCSPIQADHMGLAARLIPPPIDLSRFEKAAEHVNGNRGGAVSIASWRNYGKAPHKAAEWGAQNGGIDFWGGGELAPPGCQPVSYDSMPALLAQYQTFVFLPTVLEPFGRLVAEAWAAGCEIVTNHLVGAGYWISEKPEAIDTAAEDFWGIVTR